MKEAMLTAPLVKEDVETASKKKARWHGISRFERATDEEIRRHLPLVRKMIDVHGYGRALNYDEKIAAGLLGVAFAVEKFDPGYGVKYSYWISFQIDKAIRNETRAVTRRRRFEFQPFEDTEDPIDEHDWRERSTRDEREERERLAALAVESLKTLDPRSRLIVTRLCFEDKTQDAVARELGVTQSWVSRLACAAFKKLRKELERRSLEI